jgi:hypothetical protein
MKNFMVSNVIPTNSLPEFQYMPDEEKDYHREILPMYNAEFVNKLEEYKKAHSEVCIHFYATPYPTFPPSNTHSRPINID